MLKSKYVHWRPSDVCFGEEAWCSHAKYQDPRWASSILVRDQQSLSQPRKVSATYNNPRNVDTESDNQNVSVDGHAIERMDEIKLLGVQIDKKKFASQKVGVLVWLRNLVACNANLSLYKSSILPYLTYCNLVRHFCNALDRRKLKWIQEWTPRALYKTRITSLLSRNFTKLRSFIEISGSQDLP